MRPVYRSLPSQPEWRPLRTAASFIVKPRRPGAPPISNPLLERARNAVLDRSVREKEKMGRIWGKDPMVRAPLTLDLSCSSAYFAGPNSMTLYDEKRRGASNRGSQLQSQAQSTRGSAQQSAAQAAHFVRNMALPSLLGWLDKCPYGPPLLLKRGRAPGGGCLS